jgi:hypothetical protein
MAAVERAVTRPLPAQGSSEMLASERKPVRLPIACFPQIRSPTYGLRVPTTFFFRNRFTNKLSANLINIPK